MLRPLYEILTDDDLAALLAAELLMDEEVDRLKEQQEQAQVKLNWDMLVKLRATELCAYQNERIADARQLRKDVISYGGISQSDHESIPGKYKRKDGQAMDTIAQEMGYANDNALMLDIDGAENMLRQLPAVNGKRVRQYRIKDFENTAEVDLMDEHNLRTWEDEDNAECPF